MVVERVPVEVDGRTMWTVDEGQGHPIVFLHGNPTSSRLWRRVVPHVADLGRVIAPDLLGMGDSDKLSGGWGQTYSFDLHSRSLDALLVALDATDGVTFVGHDWGGALAFDWARRHPGAVRAIAYTETICGPRRYADEAPGSTAFFRRVRGPEGERMVLVENVFVEELLQAGTLRTLDDEEIAAYRQPFARPGEDRRVTLDWARAIPFDGQPADVHDRALAWEQWLRTSDVPKLWIRADPGALTSVFDRRCRSFPNQTEVTVPGIHFVPEDSPDEMGAALRTWMRRLDEVEQPDV